MRPVAGTVTDPETMRRAGLEPASLAERVERLERALGALLDDIASNPYMAAELARQELNRT